MSIRTPKQSLDKALEQFIFGETSLAHGELVRRPKDVIRGTEERNTLWNK